MYIIPDGICTTYSSNSPLVGAIQQILLATYPSVCYSQHEKLFSLKSKRKSPLLAFDHHETFSLPLQCKNTELLAIPVVWTLSS